LSQAQRTKKKKKKDKQSRGFAIKSNTKSRGEELFGIPTVVKVAVVAQAQDNFSRT
jgi:hypothetical protein